MFNEKQLFLMAVIIALKSYAESEISNGNVSSSSNVLVVMTALSPVKDPFNNGNQIGYQTIFLIIDRVNRTTYPFIVVGKTNEEIRNVIENTKRSLFSTSGNVMGGDSVSNNRMITNNILVNNMSEAIAQLTNGKILTDIYGDINDKVVSYISDIITESYRDIITIINNSRLNSSNIYQFMFNDPNSGISMMNGQVSLPSGLIGVLNNVYNDQYGNLNYSIYFTFSYSLQRMAKNDLLNY